MDLDCCGGLRGVLLCLDAGAAIRVGDLNLALPSAELARADCVELPGHKQLTRRAIFPSDDITGNRNRLVAEPLQVLDQEACHLTLRQIDP